MNVKEIASGEESFAADNVNHDYKVAAIQKLLSAYKPLNIKDVAAKNGMNPEEFSAGIPASFGMSLAEDTLNLLLEPESPADFIHYALTMISDLIGAVAAIGSSASRKDIFELIANMEAYSISPNGSAKEVLSGNNIKELIASINESILNGNQPMYAAFEDEDIGYSAAAYQVLNETGEEEEDDSENGVLH